MKLILTTLALAITVGTMAQRPDQAKPPAEKAKHKTERLVKELGLDAAQQAQVEAIYLDHAKAMEQVNTISEQDRPGRAEAVKTGRDNRLKEVLTAEQFQRMMDLREQRKEKKDQQRESSDD